MKELILKLREQTGMGMLDCKIALQDANGDFDKAKVLLAQRLESIKRTSFISYDRSQF